MHPGDPAFPYGSRYNKRGKMTAGRGFEDVFMSDSSFDSFLPMDDFRDMHINDSPFNTGHPFPSRYNNSTVISSLYVLNTLLYNNCTVFKQLPYNVF